VTSLLLLALFRRLAYGPGTSNADFFLNSFLVIWFCYHSNPITAITIGDSLLRRSFYVPSRPTCPSLLTLPGLHHFPGWVLPLRKSAGFDHKGVGRLLCVDPFLVFSTLALIISSTFVLCTRFSSVIIAMAAVAPLLVFPSSCRSFRSNVPNNASPRTPIPVPPHLPAPPKFTPHDRSD